MRGTCILNTCFVFIVFIIFVTLRQLVVEKCNFTCFLSMLIQPSLKINKCIGTSTNWAFVSDK